mmetsp:Transcript_26369/g.34660  ORF Transcript_26369/g.34660 Transcript_26369/m.34660 type:complete len:319 (+) Transcript_26369:164-1120(+)
MEEEDETVDYYGILGLAIGASEKKVSKAYKKMALKYHPDKNPGNEAAAMFLKIKKAQSILLDAEKRAAYDKKRNAKLKRAQRDTERFQAMDAKRRKLRDELERRERMARGEPVKPEDLTEEQRKKQAAAAEKRRFKSEVERLRQEGQRRRTEATYDAVNRAGVEKETPKSNKGEVEPKKSGAKQQIKVKWKTKKMSHSDDTLWQLFRRYGEVVGLALSEAGKGNSAVVTFASQHQAEAAIKAFEKEKDMRVTLLGDKKKKKFWTPDQSVPKKQAPEMTNLVSERDKESIAEMKIRQAAERQRLLDELQGKTAQPQPSR